MIFGMENEKKFHLKTFFVNYNTLIDHSLCKDNKENYINKLNYVGEILKNINFEKNLLILCDKPWAKEVFISGFRNLKTLRSFHVINVADMFGIYTGANKGYRETHNDSESVYESEKEIMNDVACFTCNYFEATSRKLTAFTSQTLAYTIMRRYDYVENDPNKPSKLNWIYCKGYETNLETTYPYILKLFKEQEDNPMFQILDLNKVLGLTNATPITNESIEVKDIDDENFSLDGL